MGESDTLQRFESIFANPSIEHMLALDPYEFEQFIQYVFTCAGYYVEHISRNRWPSGPGFDLQLHSPGNNRLLGYVEVRRYSPGNSLDTDDVMSFIGKLTLARNLPSFMVTTSDFFKPAYTAAERQGRVYLINGARLRRYITYVRGSRIKGVVGGKNAPVLPTSPASLIEADLIKYRSPSETCILTINNNKGGAGKTTTVLNLGFALASKNLLVDMDGQTSLTTSLPAPGPTPPTSLLSEKKHLVDYFTRRYELSEIVRQTRFENIYIIPAHPDLHLLDTGGIAQTDEELRFVRDLHAQNLLTPDGQPFDWIILDTPPAQTYNTRIAIASAHHIIIPTIIEAHGFLGINRVIRTVETMQALMGGHVDISGAVVLKWKETPTTRDTYKSQLAELSAKGIKIFSTRIPNDDKVERAHLETIGGKKRMLLNLGKQLSPAADSYQRLLEEILKDVHHALANSEQ